MTELLPNVIKDIDALVDECGQLKELKDNIDAEYKIKKIKLETLCAEYLVTQFKSGFYNMKITESRRFKAYSDDKVVLDMIPLQHRADCTSLNKKKIDGLIKKGILLNSIKDEEKFTRITTTKFTAVE